MRIAVGIGRPKDRDPDIVKEYVLGDIPPDELEVIVHTAFPIVVEMLMKEVDA